MRKTKNTYKIKTGKKNKVVVEKVNPDELNKIWDKLSEIDHNL